MTTIRPSARRSSSATSRRGRRAGSRRRGPAGPAGGRPRGRRAARPGSPRPRARAGSSPPPRHERPDRVCPVRRESARHPDDLAHERGQRPIVIARREPLAQAVLDARRVIARAGRRRGALVADDPPDGVGPQAGPKRTPAAIGVTDHVDRLRPASAGDGVGDRRHVLELALDRVGRASPDAPRPRRSMAWTVSDAASRGPTTRNVVWSADVPWTRISGGPSPAGEDRDRRPVRSGDVAGGDALRPAQRGSPAAAASSRIHVACPACARAGPGSGAGRARGRRSGRWPRPCRRR